VKALHDEPRPTGFAAMGVFLFFGATMGSLAAITLIRHGTVLDRAWRLNPTAYQQLAPLGSKIGILFLFLSVALLVAGVGWFMRRRWAWRLTILIIGTQIVGDFVNLVRGDWLSGATGVIIAGALMLYLSSPRIRAAFVLQP
jgi:Na+-translocating ferredoxin:NAD+ oxidoreductase RnfD subunit